MQPMLTLMLLLLATLAKPSEEPLEGAPRVLAAAWMLVRREVFSWPHYWMRPRPSLQNWGARALGALKSWRPFPPSALRFLLAYSQSRDALRCLP